MSQKNALIEFLQNRPVQMTNKEINTTINIIKTLEEPKQDVPQGLEERGKQPKKNN